MWMATSREEMVNSTLTGATHADSAGNRSSLSEKAASIPGIHGTSARPNSSSIANQTNVLGNNRKESLHIDPRARDWLNALGLESCAAIMEFFALPEPSLTTIVFVTQRTIQ